MNRTLRISILCGLVLSCGSDDQKQEAKNAKAEVKIAPEATKRADVKSTPDNVKPTPAPKVESDTIAKVDAGAVNAENGPIAAHAAGEEAGEMTAEEAGEEASEEISLESHYTGPHKLGVNRVNDGKRTGKGKIFREANALVLTASVKKGPYNLLISGTVKPVSKTEFVLDGYISGIPNLAYANKADKKVTTEGLFTFRATKGRKFWRLYDIDGKECVCNDGCGNEFCYIDLGF